MIDGDGSEQQPEEKVTTGEVPDTGVLHPDDVVDLDSGTDRADSPVPVSELPVYTVNSTDSVDPELLSGEEDTGELEAGKGDYFWVTIGVTYSHKAVTNTMQPIPQWGVGLFFDGAYIPLKFKDPQPNGVRPEFRFWTQDDAKAFALQISRRFMFKLDQKVFGTSIIERGPVDPIVQALTVVKDEGFKLHNLFQQHDGTWRCNIREENYFDYGDGKTATDAIEDAMRNVEIRGQVSWSRARQLRHKIPNG